MTQEEIDRHIEYLEMLGSIEKACKYCERELYPQYKKGNFNVMAPRHKASNRCKSGKKPHCTCDVCF